jgi:hypothetical protein
MDSGPFTIWMPSIEEEPCGMKCGRYVLALR